MEANAKKPKAKARPKLNPTENAALQRLEHDLITDRGTVPATKGRHAIHCLTVIGTIEGHTLSPDAQKTTKYEHVIPLLAAVEESEDIDGLLLLLNTVGGDIEAGLAIAEMIAGMKKPTVSLVLGGGHSIGIPLAVCTKKSFITPTASMTVHPVRMTGLVVGAPQTFRYFQRIQEQIADFVTANSRISREDFEHYMMATGEIATDVGTILYGKEAVASGLIDKLGGMDIYLHCSGIGKRNTDLLPEIELHFAFIDGEQHVYLKEEDVSTAIRTEEVGMAASAVGANPAVRAFLLGMQRDMAKKQDVLMDGRDIGTVVLPDATVKIFLTASPEARAARRWKEYQEKGVNTPYEEVLADVKQRDYQDTHRAAAPLKQAEDAVLLDTSELDFEQSLAAMKEIIAAKLNG